MLTPDISNAKSHCLQIYNFLEEAFEFTQYEIKKITNGEVDYDNIIVICNKTLNFARDVIDELTEYANIVETDLEKINRKSSVETADVQHKRQPKKSRFRLIKQEDEELTQDGILEINVCNIEENLNHSRQNSTTFTNILNRSGDFNADSSKKGDPEDENVDSDNSSEDENSNQSHISLLSDEEESTKDRNENDILNKIGNDTSDFQSESCSIFSVSTYVLEELSETRDDDTKNDLTLEQCASVVSDDESCNLEDDVLKRKKEKQNNQKPWIGSTDESSSSSTINCEINIEEQENGTTIGNKSENYHKFINFLRNYESHISNLHIDGSSENGNSKIDVETKIKEEKLEEDNTEDADDEVDDEEHFSEDLSETRDLNEEIRRKRRLERENLNPMHSRDSSNEEKDALDQEDQEGKKRKSNPLDENTFEDILTIDLCSSDSSSSGTEL